MMRHRWLIVTLILAFFHSLPSAQTGVADLDLRVTQADIRPAVTVQEFENRRVEKYSVNNNTYMIKITPVAGPAYYLVDEDGSGEMAWRRGTPSAENNVPQWALFRW